MVRPRRPPATKERLAAIAAMSEDEFLLFALDHLKHSGTCTVTTSSAWAEDLTTDQQQNIVQKFRQAADRIRQFDCNRFDNAMERVVLDSDIIGLDRIHHHDQTKEFRGPTALSEEEKEWERWHYDKLLKEGGRPGYHIDDLDAVAKNPEMKYHVTSPWMYYEDSIFEDNYADARVFRKQHDHWTRFRLWQRINRNHGPSPSKKLEVAVGEKTLAASTMEWYKKREFGAFQRYERAISIILGQYGISQPSALQLRTGDQDQLVTWQEYVGFMYLHLGWATQEMIENRLNGEEFLANLRSSGHVPEGTTLKEVQSMLFDAWVRGPALEIDDVRRSMQQQKEVLLEKLETADEEAKGGIQEEIRSLDERYENNEQRDRDLAAKCWELTCGPYEADQPWCVAARKVFCYERLIVWARDQIPLVRAELEGRKDCRKCRARDRNHAATDQTPVATDKTPAATDKTPAAIDQTPIAAGQTPVTTEKAPAATDQAPEAADKTPVAADKTPAAIDQTPCPVATDKTTAATDKTPAATDQTGRDAPSNPVTSGNNQDSRVPSVEASPVAPQNPSLDRTTRDQGVQVEILTDSHTVENETPVASLTAAPLQPGLASEDPPRPRKRKRVIAPVEAPRRSQRVATLKVKREEEAAAAAEDEADDQSQPPAKARRTKAAQKPKPKATAVPKSKAKPKSKRK
ncbi:unnamed protein product [Clonostachys solani]|uniref:Uncharacterized protein n=1 Tax=Clonostachys solani TaxID=160281 RepID=A0A9P0EQQ4_9HYPO|nr:unnamed protein product [Clonostachys solani]